MKEDQEIQDKIDRYLLNQMSESERKNFKIEMDNDPKLRESVDTQELIVAEINERESFMAILEEAETARKSNSSKTKPIKRVDEPSIKNRKTFHINYIYAVSIAAAIIGVVFIIWQPHKSSNQSIYNSYALAYASSNMLESSNTIKTRGGTIFFENFNPSDNAKINEALSLYYNQEYNAASIIFEQVLVPKGKNNELVLYMAISELFSNNLDTAINNLTYLSSLNNYAFKDQVDYYLSLAYIKSNQLSKARKLLNHLVEGNSEYTTQATEILNEMRWF